MVNENPKSDDLIWAGMSSVPSIVWEYNEVSSGTRRFIKDSKSTVTEGSAFSLIDKPAEVCLIKIFRRPFSGRSSRFFSMMEVMI
jgi:hypothetical protein